MWEKVRLKEICTLFDDGDWIETKHQSETGIRLIQTGNVKTGSFSDRIDKARYISEETFASLKCTEIFCEDILVSRLPQPVGRACIIPPLDERAITAVDCTIIRVQKEKVIPEFLNYFMQSPSYFSSVQSEVTGATRQRISRKKLGEIPIKLPPLAEQQRIVAKLDAAFAEIDGLINTASRQATNAKDVQLKIIEKLFFYEEKEWKKINLRTACKFSQGVQIPVEKQSLQICEGCTTRFLRIVDFTQGNEEPRFISDSDVKEILNEHDIAIVRYGASAGFVCTGLKGQIANNLFKVELETKEFDSDYLLCFLQSPMFSNFIASKVTGAAMPALSFSMFNDFDIFYPSSRDRQLSLISKFHLVDRQIENLISFHEKKLLNLKQLKETILAQELQSEAA